MKTRQGFVSNSSSSSFIIRGMKLNIDTIAEVLKLSKEELAFDNYETMELIRKKLPEGFQIKSDENFFSRENWDNYIIGKSTGYLEDGEVFELEDNPVLDLQLIQQLEDVGFERVKLYTYIQMISNDNY